MDRTNNPFLTTLKLPVLLPFSLRLLLIIAHLLAITIPWLSALSVGIKLFCSGAVLISAMYYLFFSTVVRQVADIESLILDADDGWQVRYKNGRIVDAEYCDFQYASMYLTILGLRWEGKDRFFIYTPEVLNGDRLRRLRVRMLHRVQSEPGSA